MMETLKRYSPVAGRVLFALPFWSFAIYKLRNWEMMTGWLQFEGFPAPSLILAGAIGIEMVGGCLLLVGYQVRWTAIALIIYLLPVHFGLHDYWTLEPGPERQAQVEQFGKGMMIVGGLLFLIAGGPGPFSVSDKLEQRRLLDVDKGS